MAVSFLKFPTSLRDYFTLLYKHTIHKMTFQSCNRFCIQEAIIETCKCFHPTLYQESIDNLVDEKPCYITPETTSEWEKMSS